MPERRPFDPNRVRSPRGARTSPSREMITPSRLNELIQGAIRAHLPSTVTVLGEIGNLTRAGSGHLYFSLKDAAGEVRCVVWRSNAARIRFEVESGMEVIATGGVDVYPPRGTYQLIVRGLEPRGVGALEVAFRQLREKLAAEGLFDNDRKRPLPFLPNRIGIVTSASGAALRDILQTLRRRCPTSEVLLFPARVQGDGAAGEIAAAIQVASRCAEQFGGIDVLIVGRGGGSLEDLWAFNEEVVARAIFASEIPVVSAVGHEVDVSIADLVADVRAATPTAAAELVVPVRTEIIARIETSAGRAARALEQRLHLGRQQLMSRLRSESLARPMQRVRQQTQRLDELAARLQLGCVRRLQQAGARLGTIERRLASGGAVRGFHRLAEQVARRVSRCRELLLDQRYAARQRIVALETRVAQTPQLARRDLLAARIAEWEQRLERAVARTLEQHASQLAARVQVVAACNPRQILQRGYSVTRDARSGQVLRDAEQVRPGQRVRTELAEGSFESTADDPRQGRLF